MGDVTSAGGIAGFDIALKLDNKTCVDCPDTGVECNGREKKYTGNVWHDVSILNPTSTTNMYSCVTDGCPDPGDTEMRCKVGFKADAPLCAICDEGYWAQLRECFPCEKPQWWGLALCWLFGVALLVVSFLFGKRYGHILHRTNIHESKTCIRLENFMARNFSLNDFCEKRGH